MRVAALIVALAGLAGGCGGSSGEEPPGGPLPACAQGSVAGRTVARPRQLPADFPLPPGLVLTLAKQEAPGLLTLNGFAPGTLETVGDFFETELPEHGYRLGRGDQEQYEREAPFTGSRSRGLWRIFGSPDCPDAVRVLVILIRER